MKKTSGLCACSCSPRKWMIQLVGLVFVSTASGACENCLLSGFVPVFHHNRDLSAVRCRDIVDNEEPATIIVTDEIWQDVGFDLQRLISCLPDESGGVLAFNTTGIVIPSSGVFFEKGPVVITSMAAETLRSQGGMGSASQVVFSCPEPKEDLSFMEISAGRVVLDHVLIQDCTSVKNNPIIFVESGAELIMQRFTLQNIQGSTPGNASIVANSHSHMEVEESIFRKVNGMSVLRLLKNATGIIRRSVFTENLVHGLGSAVHAESQAHLELDSVIFEENYARLGGGAICAYDINITIKGCKFARNSGMDGGALLLKFTSNMASRSRVHISNTEFMGNTAEMNGGSILLLGPVRALFKSIMVINSSASSGGALFARGSRPASNNNAPDYDHLDVLLLSSKFELNTAVQGGAIFLGQTSRTSMVTGSLLRRESSKVKQSGQLQHGQTVLTGMGLSFLQNMAEKGGAIFSQGGTKSPDKLQLNKVNISDSVFDSNSAERQGGGCLLHGPFLQCSLGPNTTFVNNSALETGGGLAILNGPIVQISNVEFLNNNGETAGGAIWARGMAHLTGIFIERSTFIHNSGVKGGGAFLLGQKLIAHFTMGTFSSNLATKGGGIFVSSGSNLRINETLFQDNKSLKEGGGICAEAISSPTKVFMSRCSLSGNLAGSGGAVAFNGLGQHQNSLGIENSYFLGNKAPVGGALHLQGDVYCCLNASTTFENNKANRGGAVYADGQGTSLDVESANFSCNKAANGAAINALGSRNLVIHNSTFSKNSDNNLKQHDAADVEPLGGAVSARAAGNMILSNSQFSNNTGLNGGALLLVASDKDMIGSLRIVHVKFHGNKAERYGGALAVLGGDLLGLHIEIASGYFVENYAAVGGGVWSAGSHNISITKNSRFTKNSAFIEAGGLFFRNPSSVRIDSSIINDNSAESGGGMSIKCTSTSFECRLSVASTAFKTNFAGYMKPRSLQSSCHNLSASPIVKTNPTGCAGGGLRLSGRRLVANIEGSVFENNSAQQGGGLYCLETGRIHMLSVNFHENEASWGGAAMISRPETIAGIKQSSFVRNKACFGGAMLTTNVAMTSPTEYHILIDRTACEENFAWICGSVLFADSPQSIAIGCDAMESVYPDFHMLDTTSVNTLSSRCNKIWKLNNVAIDGFGSIVASDPVDRVIAEPAVIYHKSGEILPPIFLRCTDLFNQTVPMKGIFAELTATSLAVTGQQTCNMFRGEGLFEGTSVSGLPGKYTLEFAFKNLDGIVVMLPAEITVEIRKCGFGEYFGHDDYSCSRCPEGHFNPGSFLHDCQPCPAHATCNGSVITPDEGYWHSHFQSKNIQRCFIPKSCTWRDRSAHLSTPHARFLTKNNSETFQGGYTQQQCREGYEGPVCGSCSSGYARVWSAECEKCGGTLRNTFALFLFWTWSILLASCLVCLAWNAGPIGFGKQVQEPQIPSTTISAAPLKKQHETLIDLAGNTRDAIEEDLSDPPAVFSQHLSLGDSYGSDFVEMSIKDSTNKPGSRDMKNPSDPELSIASLGNPDYYSIHNKRNLVYSLEIIKIVLHFLQVTSLAGFISRDWTQPSKLIFSLQDLIGAGGDSTLAIACGFSSGDSILKTTISLLFPVFAAVLVLIICAGVGASRGWQSSDIWDRWFLWVWAIIYSQYTNIIRKTLETFHCLNVDVSLSGDSEISILHWVNDTSVKCFKGCHSTLFYTLSVPFLIVVTGGWPLGIYLANKHNKSAPQNQQLPRKYIFLRQLYRPECQLWDSVVLLRKFLMVLVLVLGSQFQVSVQRITLVTILALALIGHLWVHPHHRVFRSLHRLEAMSLLFSTAIFYAVALKENDGLGGKSGHLIDTLVAISNCLVTLYLLYQAGREIVKSFSHCSADKASFFQPCSVFGKFCDRYTYGKSYANFLVSIKKYLFEQG